jgi:alkylated DNA nucleotide flippase Atl1
MAVALASAAQPAAAQVEYHKGGLSLGSTIKDRLNNRNERDRWPAPQPGYTGGVRFIPGHGYHHGGGNIIIINGAPCYVPSYYDGYVAPVPTGYYYGPAPVLGGGYNGSYGGSGYSVGLNAGGFNLNYRGQSGFVRQETRTTVIEPRVTERPTERPREPERRPAETTKPEPSGNDYYLHKKPTALQKDPALARAVADIEQAFRTGSVAPLQRHIEADGTIVLQVKDTSRQTMTAAQYVETTRDALGMLKTQKYELNNVAPASGGAMMVYGKHVLLGENGRETTFDVGFVLKKVGEEWFITEVKAEPAR